MALTPSTMLPLGTIAPAFKLPDTDGGAVSSADFGGPLLIIFLCNHCPFVKHIRQQLAKLTGEYIDKGVGVVGISSNDVETHPADSPEKMATEKREAGYRFAYLYDETQEVALAYHAACTPEFYLFDGAKQLVYRGQMDGARPGNQEPSDGQDLRAALDALLAGRAISADQKPGIGCNIKWKPGASPDYV